MFFKKATNPAKRLTRARYIELNGPSERVELLLLIFMAPLWGLVFPLIGLSTINTCGVALLGASLFCFLHFLHLNNSRFVFEENGIRLPGVDHRLLPYANMQRIYLEKLSPPLLTIEFVPAKSPLSRWLKDEAPVQQLFEIQHLTEESARQMWSLFASKLRTCSISLDVRDRLVNWRTQGSKPEPAKLPGPAPNLELDGGQAPGLPGAAHSTRSTEIARDLSMLVELRPFDPIKLVGQYMVSYSDTFRKTWLSCWMVVAGIAYPVSIATMLAHNFTERGIIDRAQAQSAQQAQTSLADLVSGNVGELTKISQDSLTQLFGNHLGALGLFVLLYVAAYKLLRHMKEPDSLCIDYLGITTQKRTAAGVLPKEHRSWKTISAINLVRPHEKSNSSRWTISFECLNDKERIEVPFKAFSSDRIRTQFIECIDTWGRNIDTSPELLEALAPRGQASYTELWLSALAEAPKIESLTPHSVGLHLQNSVYEIESQLASGGQGVAYLARKQKSANTLASRISIAEKAKEVAVSVMNDSSGAQAQAEASAKAETRSHSGTNPDRNGKSGGEASSSEFPAKAVESPQVKLVIGGEPGSEAGADDTADNEGATEKPAAAEAGTKLEEEVKIAAEARTEPAQKPESTSAEEPQYEQVVLKETVLPIYVDDRARAKALSRFERDAKLLASLQHPLIVRLEDFFVENNRAYLALEYINGKTLKEKVETEGPLPEAEVRRLALMMTDILDYLHNRTPQVVHRDFTPDNLMLTHDGTIKLIDFDVALEQSSFSQTNATIVGKQAYIPLEQFRGKPCTQSDIYALGATLYYLLTGEEPPALQSSRPRSVKVEVSEALDNIIARATAVEPADRVESAGALREMLGGKKKKPDETGVEKTDTAEGNGAVNLVVARPDDEEWIQESRANSTGTIGSAGQNGNGENEKSAKAESIKLVVTPESEAEAAAESEIAKSDTHPSAEVPESSGSTNSGTSADPPQLTRTEGS